MEVVDVTHPGELVQKATDTVAATLRTAADVATKASDLLQQAELKRRVRQKAPLRHDRPSVRERFERGELGAAKSPSEIADLL